MVIAGAGNLGLHTLDQLIDDGFTGEIVFYSNKPNTASATLKPYRIIGIEEELKRYFNALSPDFVIAVGQTRIRKKMFEWLLKLGGKPRTIVSEKHSFVSVFSVLGEACIVQPFCAISHHVTIGNNCVLHAATLVGHDVTIDDHVVVGSNVNILKAVHIGSCTTISPNVLIHPNITIGRNVYIGPGIEIKTNIADNATIVASC